MINVLLAVRTRETCCPAPVVIYHSVKFFPAFLNVRMLCYLSQCYEWEGTLFKWLMTCNSNHTTTWTELFLPSDYIDKAQKHTNKQANKQTTSLPVQTSFKHANCIYSGTWQEYGYGYLLRLKSWSQPGKILSLLRVPLPVFACGKHVFRLSQALCALSSINFLSTEHFMHIWIFTSVL
jgi:hypothetical protein